MADEKQVNSVALSFGTFTVDQPELAGYSHILEGVDERTWMRLVGIAKRLQNMAANDPELVAKLKSGDKEWARSLDVEQVGELLAPVVPLLAEIPGLVQRVMEACLFDSEGNSLGPGMAAKAKLDDVLAFVSVAASSGAFKVIADAAKNRVGRARAEQEKAPATAG